MGTESSLQERPAAYHPRDLDRLRDLIQKSHTAYPLARYGNASMLKDDEVERQLLTHMANGTTPEELEEYVKELRDKGEAENEAARIERAKKQADCQHEFRADRWYPNRVECGKCGVSGKSLDEKKGKKK